MVEILTDENAKEKVKAIEKLNSELRGESLLPEGVRPVN